MKCIIIISVQQTHNDIMVSLRAVIYLGWEHIHAAVI